MKRYFLKRYNLFLDDFRNPRDAFDYTHDTDYNVKQWLVAKTFDEFVNIVEEGYIQNNMWPGLISFDHDLADEHYYPLETSNEYQIRKANNDIDGFYNNKFDEKTGYHCAKWLVDFCMHHVLRLPEFKCHSMNPSGKENILGLLNNFRKFQNKAE